MLDIRSYVIIIIVIKEIIVSMGKNLSFSNIIRFYQNYFTKMSHNQLHCPKCTQYLQIEIDRTNLALYCKCGYTIHEYLRSFQTIQSINDTALPEEIKEILSYLQTSKNHLNSYFNELKSNYIEFALSTIKEVESAYQSSYNRNNDILSLLSILIDNYKEDSTLYHNITNHSKFDIHECPSEMEFEKIVEYYNSYNIISETLLYKRLKFISQIRTNSQQSDLLTVLNDGRIASCVEKAINIYDIYNNNKFSFEHESKEILSICQIENSDIISIHFSKEINLWSLSLLKCKFTSNVDDNIFKVVSLSNNRFATVSEEKISIYNRDVTSLKILPRISEEPLSSILFIREKDILISAEDSCRLLEYEQLPMYHSDRENILLT